MTDITQADREAAAQNILRRLIAQHGGELPWMDASTMSMRMGEQDNHPEVQAFATHRIAERERLIALIEADAKTCDCFARSDGECACGAWDDYKQVSLARVIDILKESE